MEFKYYYQTLGIKRDVDQKEIKRAYRKLARKYHPDLNKAADAEAHFKEVGEAYDVLKDPEKRAAYDQLGANWQSGQQFNPPPDWDAGFEYTGSGFEGDFNQRGSADKGFNTQDAGAHSDFFESLFGQAFRRSSQTDSQNASQNRSSNDFQANQSNDHHAKVIIDLDDSLKGATKTFSLRMPTLNAQGQLQTIERVLKVSIPKGVKSGQHIRLSGQAQPRNKGGAAGDLYLEVEFKTHPFYRVDGRDLYYDLPITPWEAALGAKIKVPTPKGSVELKIPAGSSYGRQLRLKEQGIPGKPAGHLTVVLQVVQPAADTEKAKALYQQMADTLAFNPRQHLPV
jgi:curved DNA-binding protein